MASARVASVALRGVAACVPRTVARTADYAGLSLDERLKFAKTTGIEERRCSLPGQCASDYCEAAAKRLIAELGWNKADIRLLVCVTQSPDYPVPATAVLLQQRIGLGTHCAAFDIGMGCSGYVYGLLVASSLLGVMGGGKALLVVGDTSTRSANQRDRTTAPLFGDAGTATALEFNPSAPEMVFDLNSDGRGWEAIVMRHGGFREPLTADSLVDREVAPGAWRAPRDLELNGIEVFNFGLREAPRTVEALLTAVPGVGDLPDFFFFHQANMLMNEMIRKKLKIPAEKCPYSLRSFGNTSCASIPMTMVTASAEALRAGPRSLVLCGFGVGLSWASSYVRTEGLVCPELVEL